MIIFIYGNPDEPSDVAQLHLEAQSDDERATLAHILKELDSGKLYERAAIGETEVHESFQ